MQSVMKKELEDANLFSFLFLLTIMTFHDTIFFVYHMKNCRHWLIICNTFRVSTFNNSVEFIRHLYFFFFYYFIVTDNVKFNMRRNNGNTIDFLIAEKFVCNLNNAFFTQFLTVQIESDG